MRDDQQICSSPLNMVDGISNVCASRSRVAEGLRAGQSRAHGEESRVVRASRSLASERVDGQRVLRRSGVQRAEPAVLVEHAAARGGAATTAGAGSDSRAGDPTCWLGAVSEGARVDRGSDTTCSRGSTSWCGCSDARRGADRARRGEELAVIPAGVEIFVALAPIDLRYGFDRLAGLASPLSRNDPVVLSRNDPVIVHGGVVAG
jgi:hypothetical protein